MSHTLYLGSKAFDVDGFSMGYATREIRSDSGRPVRWLVQFTADGKMLGSGSADLSKKELQAKNALAVPFPDVKLVDSVAGPVGISIFDNKTLSGVMLTDGPTFRDSGEPGEYVTFRTLHFAGEAHIIIPGQGTVLTSYQESIQFIGNGGPRRRWRLPINAAPIRQTISPASIVTVIQSGRAFQHSGGWPNAPLPFYGYNYVVNERDAVRRIQPIPVGKGWVNYGIEWNYIFEMPGRPSTSMPALPKM